MDCPRNVAILKRKKWRFDVLRADNELSFVFEVFVQVLKIELKSALDGEN